MNMDETQKTSEEVKNHVIERLLESKDPVQTQHVLKIMDEFVAGFEILRTCDLSVTVFGSARCTLGEDLYETARSLSGRLSKSGFTIITGGGGGVMQAANQGAFEAGGRSIGFNIDLPEGQMLNHYTTDSLTFHHFFSRKVMLAYSSEAYVFFPGGFGTLDELFEMLTLVQTKKVRPIPVILVGKEFWTPLLSFIETTLYEKYKTINKEDSALYHLVDSADEAYNLITTRVKA